MAQTTSPPGGEQSTQEQVADKAQELAGQAREQAGQAAEQARGQLRTQVEQRSTQAGEQVRQHADDIRSVAEQLRSQGKDQPAQLAERAAQHAERVGSYLQESDTDRLLHDVEDFARRQPWAVVAGGLALGFAASRLLKASSTERYERSVDQHRRPTPPPALPADGAGPGMGNARFERELPPSGGLA